MAEKDGGVTIYFKEGFNLKYIAILELYILMDGFYVFFNSISVIRGQQEGDNEKLCVMETCLR